MSMLWPGFLLLLCGLPLLIAAYVWALRRRRVAVRYSSLALVRAAQPSQARLRRHLPFALLVLALASLMIALGRPAAVVQVPTSQVTIILAIDVSRSMLQNDIPPNRIAAAQAAALSFIQSQQGNAQIGIVAFAGFAEMIQPPTSDQEALTAAVESLTTGRGTAIGTSILKSLEVIAQINPNVAPPLLDASQPAPPSVPRGVYTSEIIVVLTDGVTTTGPLPLEAAQQAVDRGVRVYTIGFGTEQGSAQFGGVQQFGRDQQSGGSGFRRGIDEATLQQIADMTDGLYYTAASADELQDVFRRLPTSLITKTELMEVSVGFTAIGALLAGLAIGLAMRWNPLP